MAKRKLISEQLTAEITVPELDKGNHNNKKTLCDFLEQEAIAKKMIEEAQAFYKSFLKSKTVPFSKILEYPNTYIIHPSIKAFCKEISTDSERGVTRSFEPDDEIDIVISFYTDLGDEYYTDFFKEKIHMYDIYDRCNEYKSKDRKWYFKDYKAACQIHNEFEAFKWGKARIMGTDGSKPEHYIIPDITEAGEKIFTYKVSEILKYDELKDVFKPLDEWNYDYKTGLNRRFLSKKSADKLNAYLSGRGYFDHHSEKDSEQIPEFRCIPEINDYIVNRLSELNARVKEIYRAMLGNYHFSKKLLDTPYIIKKDGTPIILTTEEIKKSEVDKVKGIYSVQTKSLEDVRPKYKWPGDAPLLVTEYCQVFRFDIATNDLVTYEFVENTEEVSRKHRY